MKIKPLLFSSGISVVMVFLVYFIPLIIYDSYFKKDERNLQEIKCDEKIQKSFFFLIAKYISKWTEFECRTFFASDRKGDGKIVMRLPPL